MIGSEPGTSGRKLSIIVHPAVSDRLAVLRDATTPTALFRRTVEDLGIFLAYEATGALRTSDDEVQTPIGSARVQRIAARPVVAPILRAGLGLLPGFLHVVDDAIVAHLGFYRDPKTLDAVAYYANVPDDLSQREVFVLDPMLATGHSGSAALRALVARGAQQVTFVCLIAAPEGINALRQTHPNVHIVTAAVDERLNEHSYIVPGLGDAGDRMFGSTSSVPTKLHI
jgi:uracil phosphoribosyltransferase